MKAVRSNVSLTGSSYYPREAKQEAGAQAARGSAFLRVIVETGNSLDYPGSILFFSGLLWGKVPRIFWSLSWDFEPPFSTA